MDTQPGAGDAPEKPSLTVTPAPGSVLDDLLARHHAAKTALGDMAVREKDLRIQVEIALAHAHPGTGKFAIAGTPRYPASTLLWVPGTRRLNGKRLKTEQPVLWEAYAEDGDGYWNLRPARGL